MKQYELVVLFHPDLEIDLEKPLKKVQQIIQNEGGKISKTDIWGKRKLAYQIKKEDFAVYTYFELELPSESVSKVENTLNIADEVLRYLLTYPVPEIEEEKPDKAPKEKSSKAEPSKEE